MKFGSLFSGIGGLELGLERAGFQVAWQVEINDWCRKVLTKHWPNVPKFTDVCEVGKHNLEPVEMIVGGFPCQDISYAGKRAGLEGERSGLFYQFARIIGEMGPRIVLMENVAALLTRGLDAVLGTLASLGYDAEWHCIPAAAVGAPHIRDRVFLLGYPEGERCGEGREGRSADAGEGHPQPERSLQVVPDAPSGGWDAAQNQVAGCGTEPPGQQREGDAIQTGGLCGDVPDPDRQGLAVGESILGNARKELTAFERDCRTGSGIWVSEPGVGRVVDGVPDRVDRIRGLGNAVVPQVGEFIGRMILARM